MAASRNKGTPKRKSVLEVSVFPRDVLTEGLVNWTLLGSLEDGWATVLMMWLLLCSAQLLRPQR